MNTVMGLDLSLSSTGVASSRGWVNRIRGTTDGSKFSRVRLIKSAVIEYVRHADLVVVEGPSFGSGTAGRQGGHHERAGLWWLVMDAVDSHGKRWMEVPPAVLKKYATGKGNAGKDEVLAAAVRRFPHIEVRGNDEADALWLAAIGTDLLGKPMVDMPAVNRSGLAKLALPEGVAA